MKYRKFRGALALLLVLSLFVSFCSLTAFAMEDDSQSPVTALARKGYDSFAKIAAIIILDHSFDGRGGTVPGKGETFKFQGPMGLTTVLPAAPEKENDSFLGWKAEVNGETRTFNARQRVHLWEATNFTAAWASDGDVNPNEAGMKLDARG